MGDFSIDAAHYTSSVDIDPRILQAVIKINIAHMIMLSNQSIVSKNYIHLILSSLASIPNDLELKELLEDVHMNVEDYVIRNVGSDAGGMLNLGKSRNDQISTALRMALRSELLLIMGELIKLRNELVLKALENAATIMPGYTHLQRAQPITAGHHLLFYEEVLERDMQRLVEGYGRVNKCPMGAGALASSGYQIDRNSVADLLGFDGLVENSLDAVSSRDFAIESIFVCAQILVDVSRLAEEIVLWTTKEFSFATISDSFSSTSSMMPQKKNAIVPEIARARASQVLGDLVASMSIVKSLPLSYNLDLQELTRNLWSAVDKTRGTLEVFTPLIREIQFNVEVMKSAVEGDETLFATELADLLVTKYALSFRKAHGRVGALVKLAEEKGHLSRFLSGASENEIASILGMDFKKKDLLEALRISTVLRKRRAKGAPNPKLVIQSCRMHQKIISHEERLRRGIEQKLTSSEESLRSNLASFLRKVVFSKGTQNDRSSESKLIENSGLGLNDWR